MGKAIIRVQKLKSAVAVRRSMKHAFREQETPNADAERTPDNTHIGAQNTAEAMQRFNEAMPDKVRKNAVLAVEYLVTASPESMQGKSRQEQDAYFRDSLKWLQDKHGAENVVYAGIHRDETTPHMYAYVVPKDERGRLNCRAFYGERDALSKMQTDFAASVGNNHGLERGVEGSKARHTEIRQYYARVSAATPRTPSIDLPEAGLLEGKSAYGQRVAKSVLDQVEPEFSALRAKAQHSDLVQQRAAAAERAKKQAESTVQQQAAAIQAERDKAKQASDQLKDLVHTVARGGETLTALQTVLRTKFEQRQQAESAPVRQQADKGRDKGPER